MILLAGSFAGWFVMSGLAIGSGGATHSGWGAPVQLSSGGPGTVWSPEVAVDLFGNAVAVWEQNDDDKFTQDSIWASRFTPAGGWSGPTQLATGQGGIQGPHVAIDASGIAVAVWATSGTVWASDFVPEFSVRRPPHVGWSTPFATQGGGGYAGQPQLSLDGSGRALVVWYENDGNRSSVWANWFAPGSGWEQPLEISSGTDDAGLPQVASSPTGTAIVAWMGVPFDNRYNSRLWVTSFSRGAGWAVPTRIGLGCPDFDSIRVASTAVGKGFMVWTQRDPDTRADCGGVGAAIYAVSFAPESGWGTPVRGPLGRLPDIAVSEEGDVTVVWCGQGQPGWSCADGIWLSRFSLGAGWSTATLITSDEDHIVGVPPKVAVDRSGHTLVVWSQTSETSENGTGNLIARYLVPAAGWSWTTPVAISPAYGVQQNIAIDPAGNTFVIWTGLRERTVTQWRTDIWSNRFVWDSVSDPIPPTGSADFVGILATVALALSVSSATLLFAVYRTHRTRSLGPDGTASGSPKTVRWPRTGGRRWMNVFPAARADPARLSDLGRFAMEWPKANGPLRLTAKERILLHLLDFARYSDAPEVPMEITQPGVSRAGAVDLRHFAQYVRPMTKEGLVRERSAHIKGLVKRHKVYVLADEGKRMAIGVKDRIRSTVVRVRDDSGVREATIADVLVKRRGSRILDIVRESIEAGVVDLRS